MNCYTENGCNEVLLYELLDKHQNGDCQYQPKQCRGCLKPDILKKDLVKHEEQCDQIEIQCKTCNYVYKQKDKHDKTDCLNKQLALYEQRIKLLEEKGEKNMQTIKQLEERVYHQTRTQEKSDHESTDSSWLNGTWEGVAYQCYGFTGSKWKIVLRANATEGTFKIDYPTLGAGGHWILVENKGLMLMFREKITYGQGCSQNDIISIAKLGDGTALFRDFVHDASNLGNGLNDHVAFATLIKQYCPLH
ncbi:unnamed protein product [Didymodactylos carnosus]|uniref:Uncharacterized protein n=1 Tax=Didymodactylos carnosus TaxID=1234261 RepID=A0A8S2U7H8_9BILA|nr:unnamed protein product [Didymodactylos carnosus]CAF4328062.1 unnamed protein product [Didymodactylos carnosus]